MVFCMNAQLPIYTQAWGGPLYSALSFTNLPIVSTCCDLESAGLKYPFVAGFKEPLSRVPMAFFAGGPTDSGKAQDQIYGELHTAIRRMAGIRHPLSNLGKNFLEQAKRILANRISSQSEVEFVRNQFPTVEEPHLEYFADVFEDIPTMNLTLIMGYLNTIQVTKGCSHQCSMCALSADPSVEVMPFVTVLKIAEAIRKNRSELMKTFRQKYQQQGEEIVRELRQGIVNRQKIRDHIIITEGLNDGILTLESPCSLLYRTLFVILEGRNHKGHEHELIDKLLSPDEGNIGSSDTKKQLDEYWELGTREERIRKIEEIIDVLASSDSHVLLRGEDSILPQTWTLHDMFIEPSCKGLYQMPDGLRLHGEKAEGYLDSFSSHKLGRYHQVFLGKSKIFNYNDSDPFDYRDGTIRHKDGSPADYGDVVEALERILGIETYIVTAGWRKSDKVSARAAKKIAELKRTVEVSVHFKSKQAIEDPDGYRESLKKVISIMHPYISFRTYGTKEQELVVSLYRELGLDTAQAYFQEWHTALVGRAESLGEKPSYSDSSFNTEAGYYIHPNGEIVISDSLVERGSPPPIWSTGFNVYTGNSKL